MKRFVPLVTYLAFLVALAVAVSGAIVHHDSGVLSILGIVLLIALVFGHPIVDQAASGRFE